MQLSLVVSIQLGYSDTRYLILDLYSFNKQRVFLEVPFRLVPNCKAFIVCYGNYLLLVELGVHANKSVKLKIVPSDYL